MSSVVEVKCCYCVSSEHRNNLKETRRMKKKTSHVKRRHKRRNSSSTSSSGNESNGNDHVGSVMRKKTGYPNVEWRAIPVDHLRAHPCYSPLPQPHSIRILRSWRDVSLFRQSSWQWELLHRARVTSSRIAAVLGMLEPAAADAMGVPKSLCGHRRAVLDMVASRATQPCQQRRRHCGGRFALNWPMARDRHPAIFRILARYGPGHPWPRP